MPERLEERSVRAIIARARAGGLVLADFATALRCPLVTGLSRWEWWALVGFVRHTRRQQWVGYIVETKLRGDGRELAAKGAFGHPEDVEQEGPVPDTPGWRYYFHGRGCCLTHEDGTVIDADFAEDGSARAIDRYFYVRFLSSVPKPDWSDAQLRYPSPLERAWHLDLDRLSVLGYIDLDGRSTVTTVGQEWVERLEPIVDEINRLSAHPESAPISLAWLLVMLGDPFAAARVMDNAPGEIGDMLRVAAAAQIEARVNFLRSASWNGDHHQRHSALEAWATLGRVPVEPEVRRVLEFEPLASVHLLALDLVASWDDPACEPLLLGVLRRFGPQEWGGTFEGQNPSERDQIEYWRSAVLIRAVRLVLSHRTRATLTPQAEELVRAALADDRGICEAESCFLLGLLSPRAGVAKLGAALRHPAPFPRQEAVVFLEMIGTDASLETLIEIANGPAEQGGHEAACALALFDHPRARAAAEAWQRRHDGYEDIEGTEVEIHGRKRQTWAMTDIMRAQKRQRIEACAERLRRDYGSLLSRWPAR